MLGGYSKSMAIGLGQDFVLDALLQYNFLPNQRSEREELPPIISSESFSKSLAEKLQGSQYKRPKAYPGYDVVEYKLTRFNGVSRSCSIPHPRAYACLALGISENWGHLDYIVHNETSGIRPKRHKDGRIIIMDYGEATSRTQQELKASFGQRFKVNTDISNFYPSTVST